MKDRKNIDQIFNEGFKDFETSPSPRVWVNIQAELKKEKNRKPIPLWIKYGGVAAVLALLLTIGNFVFNPFESIPQSIPNEKIVEVEKNIQQIENGIQNDSSESQVATEITKDGSRQEINNSVDKTIQNEYPKVIDKSSETEIVSRGFENTDTNVREGQYEDSNQNKNRNSNFNQGIVSSTTTSDLLTKNGEKTNNNNSTQQRTVKNEEIISDRIDNRISESEKSIKTEEMQIETENVQASQNKKSLLDAIAEKEMEPEVDLLYKKQKPEHRWVVTPNVAPVYYSSLGNGSSIDPDFSNNPQKGDVNMSYGLQVSYALSERLSVRTGVNNVDLSYSTLDILIGTGPVAMGLRSVDYGSKQVVVTALSRESLTNGVPSNSFGEITLKSAGGDARLIQNINYYEIPLELEYAIINTKFGVNLIGGVSTLFLGNNEISVKSENFSSALGEANNLSNVSFSTNVGLGLDYKLSQRFIFNMEPMFKYQINPYTDSSVNFKPYYLGVYSGFSFKF